jgi:hypothetical protein
MLALRSRSVRALLFVGAFSFSSLAHAQGDVWRVDDDPGPDVDFNDLQPAVDAAVSGDLILVADGTYSAFTIDGKALAVVAEGRAEPLIVPNPGQYDCSLRNLPAGGQITLRGLTLDRPATMNGPSLLVENCDGVVWIEDFEVVPFTLVNPFGSPTTQARTVEVRASQRVVMSRIAIAGMPGSPQGSGGFEFGSTPLDIEDSTVHLYDGSITAAGTLVSGSFGPVGVDVANSLLVMRGTTVVGGGGGAAGVFGSPGAGTGGPGVQATGGSTVYSIGSTVSGGPGGSGGFGEPNVGEPGPPFAGETIFEHPASNIGLDSQLLPTAGAVTTLTVTAEPGSIAVLAAAVFADPVFLGIFPDTSVVGLTPIYFPLGVVDASGQISLDLPTPPIPSIWGHFGYPLQAFAVTPSTDLEFSNPTFVSTLNPPE